MKVWFFMGNQLPCVYNPWISLLGYRKVIKINYKRNLKARNFFSWFTRPPPSPSQSKFKMNQIKVFLSAFGAMGDNNLLRLEKYFWINWYTGLPTMNETVKTTGKSQDITISTMNWIFCLDFSLLRAYLMLWQRANLFTMAGSYIYQETDSMNFVQSSLKSHPLWVTL